MESCYNDRQGVLRNAMRGFTDCLDQKWFGALILFFQLVYSALLYSLGGHERSRLVLD
jgi:hypothetical protein